MARAMGLNTVATYVLWNVHKPTPGHFDFSGQYDLAAFLKAAQEEGLYVILRAGPYACAEWEFGGFPSWLLKDPAMAHALRTNDPSSWSPRRSSSPASHKKPPHCLPSTEAPSSPCRWKTSTATSVTKKVTCSTDSYPLNSPPVSTLGQPVIKNMKKRDFGSDPKDLTIARLVKIRIFKPVEERA